MIAVIPKSHAANRMTDIFISYSRNDQQWVAKLAKALEDVGYAVWWDTQLLPGDDFHHTIPAVLEKARCAVVVWSKVSVGRKWVLAEANYALERDLLVPVSIEKVKPPLLFTLTHTENMQSWDGKPNHPAFQRLLQAVARHCPPPTPVIEPYTGNKPNPKPEPESPSPKRSYAAWLTVAIVVAVAIGMFLYLDRQRVKAPSAPVADKPTPAATVQAAEKQPDPVKAEATPTLEPTLEEKVKQAREWLDSGDKTREQQAIAQLEPLVDESPEAAFLLGAAYYYGLGVDKSIKTGCVAFKGAASAGSHEAKEIIDAKLCD